MIWNVASQSQYWREIVTTNHLHFSAIPPGMLNLIHGYICSGWWYFPTSAWERLYHHIIITCTITWQKPVTFSGLPPGVLNLVLGTGARAGDTLVKHPDVKLVSFTGSTITAQHLRQAAAPHCKKISLEVNQNHLENFSYCKCTDFTHGHCQDTVTYSSDKSAAVTLLQSVCLSCHAGIKVTNVFRAIKPQRRDHIFRFENIWKK